MNRFRWKSIWKLLGNAFLLPFQRLRRRIRKLNSKKSLNLNLKWRWWKKSLQPKQTAQRRSICAIHWSSLRFSSLSSFKIALYTPWGSSTQRNTSPVGLLSSNNWMDFLLIFSPASEVNFTGTLTISCLTTTGLSLSFIVGNLRNSENETFL